MTNAKKERIKELEKYLTPLFADASGFDDRYRVVKDAVSDIFSISFNDKDYKLMDEYKDRIIELGRLYDELMYKPDEDEKALSYLFRDGMTPEEKLKTLANAWWYATNSGYSDAMANRLMAGEEDAQTSQWEQNCSNKNAIGRYYDWLKEQSEA